MEILLIIILIPLVVSWGIAVFLGLQRILDRQTQILDNQSQIMSNQIIFLKAWKMYNKKEI